MEPGVDASISPDATMQPADFLEGAGPNSGPMTLTPALVALTTAIVCAIASESIVWYLIYRHEDYTKLCADYSE